MQARQIKKILRFYKNHKRYVKDDRYSDSSQIIYIRPKDKSHWLVAKYLSRHQLEIHQTNEHGTIIVKDTYEIHGDLFKCVSVERLQADGKKWISFDEGELDLVYQYGSSEKTDTLAVLHRMLSKVKGTTQEKIVARTVNKITLLAQDAYSNLFVYVKIRKLYEENIF